MKFSSTTTIKADRSKVFDVFTDLSKITERISGIIDLEILKGPAKLEVGTKWKETRIVFGKRATETMWVSELEKDKNYSVDAESNGTKYHSTITFEESNNGTEVTWLFEGTPQTFFAKAMSLMTIVFARSVKKLIDDDLRDLKEACEAL